MRNYVFFFPSICNIGGAQLYLINKMRFLNERGWNVQVYYTRKNIFLIKELEQFSSNYYPYLFYSTLYYRKRFIKRYVKVISNTIRKNSQQGYTVIESSTASLSTWCELIAEELHCKHICFDFEEVFPLSDSQLSFAYFKHIRHELAGITPESIPLMFKNSSYRIEKPEHYLAYAVPTIQDAPSELSKLLYGFDVVIGSLGRLEKEIVWPSLIGIREYILSHREKKVAVLLIGDTRNASYKKRIVNLFNGIAQLFITGEIWPVPRSLVLAADVFVSSAGAAIATAIEDIPTISMSPKTMRPLGILNYTTKDVVLPSEDGNNDCFGVCDLLSDILDNAYCKKNESLHLYDNHWANVKYMHTAEFSRQEKIAEESNTKDYYDVFSLRSYGIRRWVTIYGKLVGHFLCYRSLVFMEKNVFRLVERFKGVHYTK